MYIVRRVGGLCGAGQKGWWVWNPNPPRHTRRVKRVDPTGPTHFATPSGWGIDRTSCKSVKSHMDERK